MIVSLALFLTAFVMGPALQRTYETGIRPLIANEITAEQAFERGSIPLRDFMQKNVNSLPSGAVSLVGQLGGLREQQKAYIAEVGRYQDRRSALAGQY